MKNLFRKLFGRKDADCINGNRIREFANYLNDLAQHNDNRRKYNQLDQRVNSVLNGLLGDKVINHSAINAIKFVYKVGDTVTFVTTRPGLLIGKGGKTVDLIKEKLSYLYAEHDGEKITKEVEIQIGFLEMGFEFVDYDFYD
jgi:ribosomal protein S3